ncbi:MAG: helix-turn-helix domain-containing protein [Alphaproteobacteria bacterium]
MAVSSDFIPLCMSLHDVAHVTGISRAKLYQLIKAGDLKACKIGTRTVIRRADLDTFLSGLQQLNN